MVLVISEDCIYTRKCISVYTLRGLHILVYMCSKVGYLYIHTKRCIFVYIH